MLFQAALKVAGALLCAALLMLEEGTGIPLLLDPVQRAAEGTQTQLALLFMLLQAVPAALAAPLHRPVQRWLDRTAPATRVEELSRPRHLFPAALEDSPSALAGRGGA